MSKARLGRSAMPQVKAAIPCSSAAVHAAASCVTAAEAVITYGIQSSQDVQSNASPLPQAASAWGAAYLLLACRTLGSFPEAFE